MDASSQLSSSYHQELALGHLDTSGYVFISATVLMSVTAASLNLAMGCTLQPEDFKRQWNTLGGTFAGALLQYVVFPGMAYVLCHVLGLPGQYSVGITLVASCPSSPLTGLVTHCINGDVCLSLCLSAVCSAVSFGLAPAILFLYTRSWMYESLHIALWPLAVTFVLQIIPPIVGYLIKKNSADAAQLIEKICTVVGVLSFSTDSLLQIVAHHDLIWHADGYMVSHTSGGLVVAILLLPAMGWLSAYTIAWLFRQNIWKRRTICVEILVHNVSLAMVILGTTFHDFRHKSEVATVLSFFNLVSGLYGLVVIIVYNVRAPWTQSGDGGLSRVQELHDLGSSEHEAASVSDVEEDLNASVLEQEGGGAEGTINTLQLPMTWGPITELITDNQENAHQRVAPRTPQARTRGPIKVTLI